jgi:DNA-binding transcriptional regulator YhcF (GntR family)
MNSSFTPVDYVYKELLDEAIVNKRSGKIFFFNDNNQLDSAEGIVESVSENGQFVNLVPSISIRMDRIITLFGQPFAAYDEYESYGNVCLDCKGGYDFE